MVVMAKKNGKARHTVDFKALNRAAPRQTHATEAPFLLASQVPADSWKTCLDAWEGYHSVPLHEDDRQYTQFITPWGRYEYLVVPQGFLAAGDGYTQRFDQILARFINHRKLVDDSVLWSNSIEDSFMQTCDFLSHCSRAGVVFREPKLQFC